MVIYHSPFRALRVYARKREESGALCVHEFWKRFTKKKKKIVVNHFINFPIVFSQSTKNIFSLTKVLQWNQHPNMFKVFPEKTLQQNKRSLSAPTSYKFGSSDRCFTGSASYIPLNSFVILTQLCLKKGVMVV